MPDDVWGAQQHKRNSAVLWGLILAAVAYGGALRYFRALTGIALVDGSIGVVLGLFICAHPAANAVNALFFEREILDHLSDWAVMRWLGLNLLTLLAGWAALFIGIRRLVA